MGGSAFYHDLFPPPPPKRARRVMNEFEIEEGQKLS